MGIVATLVFSVVGMVLVSIRVPPTHGSINNTDHIPLVPYTHIINLGTLSTLDTASATLTSPNISIAHLSLVTYKAPIGDTIAIIDPSTPVPPNHIHSFHTLSLNNKDATYPPASTTALDHHNGPFAFADTIESPLRQIFLSIVQNPSATKFHQITLSRTGLTNEISSLDTVHVWAWDVLKGHFTIFTPQRFLTGKPPVKSTEHISALTFNKTAPTRPSISAILPIIMGPPDSNIIPFENNVANSQGVFIPKPSPLSISRATSSLIIGITFDEIHEEIRRRIPPFVHKLLYRLGTCLVALIDTAAEGMYLPLVIGNWC